MAKKSRGSPVEKHCDIPPTVSEAQVILHHFPQKLLLTQKNGANHITGTSLVIFHHFGQKWLLTQKIYANYITEVSLGSITFI
jgi:hypothetical protein